MATIHEEVRVAAPAERVWDAVRDVGALHTRLVPGFVTKTEMEGESRIVTFANGMIVREPIVSLDDARRRLAWTAAGVRTTHYNAVLQVIDEGDRCLVAWTTDLLPHELAPMVQSMMKQGLATLRATLEK